MGAVKTNRRIHTEFYDNNMICYKSLAVAEKGDKQFKRFMARHRSPARTNNLRKMSGLPLIRRVSS